MRQNSVFPKLNFGYSVLAAVGISANNGECFGFSVDLISYGDYSITGMI